MTQKISAAAVTILIALISEAPLFAQSTPYFQGKTILLVQGREPGGTGALRVQAAIPFIKKYLPGEPVIVTQFMPGGGGRKATNYIYHNAKPDGMTFGNVGSGLIANAILGSTGVEYDIDKLIYLGASNSTAQYVFGTTTNWVLIPWTSSGRAPACASVPRLWGTIFTSTAGYFRGCSDSKNRGS